MGSRKGLNESRLKTIIKRQDFPSWGPDYVPSIVATPAEAPSISRAFILTPSKLGREAHFLSTPERNFALLGLYHPHVCGLQEQRMLQPSAGPHPLWSFPGIDRTSLPPIKGIIDVADRLGSIDLLPKIKVANPQNPYEPITVAFPWIGDLLWAIQPRPWKVYCVNWTVKATYADFKRPSVDPSGRQGASSTRALTRHEIERVYYEDARIRTVQVADEGLDFNVSANLRQLFLHHRRQLNLTEEQQAEILHAYRSAMEIGVPPTEVILDFASKNRYSVHQCRSLLYQAIWNRELRVDLFKPILINLPLRHEEKDVIDVYAAWFKE